MELRAQWEEVGLLDEKISYQRGKKMEINLLDCIKVYDIRGSAGINIDTGIVYRVSRAVA